QTFKNYMRDFTSRVNSITGIAYKDDPTIMSWELANEAECKADPGALQGILAGWYAEMSAYLKSVDPNHLISTGEEGFDTTTSGYTSLTSYTTYFLVFSWFDGTGFTQNVALPDIDWGGIHLYPNTWQWLDPVADGTNWIADHVGIARSHGKPLVLGEYGLQSSPHSIYKTWMDAVISSNAAGALLWEFIPASRAAQTTEPFNVIYPTDAADVANLEQAAAVLNAK
ncbi:MAG TPA: cellulase family glycosylhydrolase, partial [Planctomycetota bacterium]|nr:cellulase family glycosylhydrolase [Planctomycetota bacterium]